MLPEVELQDTFSLRYVTALSEGTGSETTPVVQRTIRPFVLDRFEVTVSRFREFLAAFDNDGPPKHGAGAHPAFPGSGWDSDWVGAGKLAPAAGLLQGELQRHNSFSASDARGDVPVRGVNWYAAFAFCIWDGGRLPTEAEWTYAAFGGREDRDYPWSVVHNNPANHDLAAFSDRRGDTQDPVPVGSFPLGRGRFGHDDLAGNLSEWMADSELDELSVSCAVPSGVQLDEHECLQSEQGAERVERGGSYATEWTKLRNVSRSSDKPHFGLPSRGFRCARDLVVVAP